MNTTVEAITTDPEQWREALRITLAKRSGGTADAAIVAEATSAVWSRIAALLAPVLGALGVEVIFRRSLYLTRLSFPWLAIEEHGERVALVASLNAQLAGRDASEAVEVCFALLVNFTALLRTLVGESLTKRLLSPVRATSGAAIRTGD